jgi:hypothetical protein
VDTADLRSKLHATLDEAPVTADLKMKDATKAFFGQINNHSQAAKEKMRCFRVAKLVDE